MEAVGFPLGCIPLTVEPDEAFEAAVPLHATSMMERRRLPSTTRIDSFFIHSLSTLTQNTDTFQCEKVITLFHAFYHISAFGLYERQYTTVNSITSDVVLQMDAGKAKVSKNCFLTVVVC